MKLKKVYRYPETPHLILHDGDQVQVINGYGKFTDCYFANLEQGDVYHVPSQEPRDYFGLIEERAITFEYSYDAVTVRSYGNLMITVENKTGWLEEALDYIIDMDDEKGCCACL